MNTLERSAPVYVAGHRGMAGSAIVRRLQALGCTDIVTAGAGLGAPDHGAAETVAEDLKAA
jgi:nucleoside-diphosphate-sugar epimerase